MITIVHLCTKNRCLWNTNALFPNISKKKAWPFDPSPTYMNINSLRGHLLIKNYLPTKCEASAANHSWIISCTRCGRPTWPFTLIIDLLTWISIGIIYSSRTIYLLSMKLMGQSVLELSVTQGDQLDLWPWPTDLVINRDHLLIKDYLPTKFEASGAKRSRVISCTRCGRWPWPLTYWPEHL